MEMPLSVPLIVFGYNTVERRDYEAFEKLRYCFWTLSLAYLGGIWNRVPNWMNDLNDAKELALRERRPIILFLHSRRCFYCPKIIEGVLPDENLKKFLNENFITLALDTSTGSDSIEEDTADQATRKIYCEYDTSYLYLWDRKRRCWHEKVKTYDNLRLLDT